jgi:hypothetical protein
MKTTLPVQTAIIVHYVDLLTKKGIKAKKDKARSGGLPHIRMDYQGDSAELLNQLWPCTIGESDSSASGSYETLQLTLKKAIPNIAPIGAQCLLVVTVKKAGTGILKTKQLNPNSFGIAGEVIPKAQFIKTIDSAINGLKTIPDTMKIALGAVLLASSTASGDTGSSLNSITPSDLKVIEKDFGEMSGALWYMTVHDKAVTAIEFPSAANEALVDYYAIKGKEKLGVSAKGGAGAAPSILTIARILEKKQYKDSNKEKARKAIIAIGTESIVDGVISSAKAIKAPGYEWLKKNMFKGDFTAADIEPALKSYRSYKGLLADLAGFYKANGHGAGENAASEAVAKRVFEGGGKRIGFIVGPLGYGVKDELNKDPVFVEVLNDATSSISTVQIYMNIKKEGNKMRCQYDVHGFQTADFKFSYQNSVGNLSNKISFKMVTKKA